MKRNWGTRGLPRLGAVVAVLALSSHAYGAPAQATPSPAPAPKATEKKADAPEPDAPRPRQVEARADALMKEMSAFLAKQPRFALEAEETLDEVYAGAPRIQLTNVRRAAIQRPARFASDATGDTLNRSSWYDGKTITALEKDDNTYLTVEMPGHHRRGAGQAGGRIRDRRAPVGLRVLGPLRDPDGRRGVRRVPGHPPGRGRSLPSPRLLPGRHRLADLDRRRSAAPAPEARHHLRGGAGSPAIHRGHQALEPRPEVHGRAVPLRAPRGRDVAHRDRTRTPHRRPALPPTPRKEDK